MLAIILAGDVSGRAEAGGCVDTEMTQWSGNGHLYLRFDAGLSVSQEDNCPGMGAAVTLIAN